MQRLTNGGRTVNRKGWAGASKNRQPAAPHPRPLSETGPNFVSPAPGSHPAGSLGDPKDLGGGKIRPPRSFPLARLALRMTAPGHFHPSRVPRSGMDNSPIAAPSPRTLAEPLAHIKDRLRSRPPHRLASSTSPPDNKPTSSLPRTLYRSSTLGCR